jgi:hypothetical protein
VFGADIPTPQSVGFPLHVYSGAGRLLRSFGADVAVYRADMPMLIDRRLSMAHRSGTFWAVRTTSYVIEQIDTLGRVLSSWNRAPAWFRGDEQWRTPSTARPPPAQVTAVYEDRAGRLWVTTLIPDSAWRQSVSDSTMASGKASWRIANYDKYFDTVLEVLDPATRRVLASRRLDGCLPFLLDDRLLGSFGTSANGVPTVDLWRVRLIIQPIGEHK